MTAREILLRAVPLIAGLLAFIFLIVRLAADSTVPSASLDGIAHNLDAGRPMQALYHVEARAALTGWTPDLLRTAGVVWRQVGDLELAAAYWEAALQQPDDTALARELADVYIVLQRWPDAADLLRQVLTALPDDNRAHFQLGSLQAAFNPREARVHLQLAARDPLYRDLALALVDALGEGRADALTAMRVGVTLAEHDAWDYAELAFGHAVALGQPFPEALAYQGLARDRQGKDGGDQIAAAVALAPNNAQVRYLQGLHLRASGDLVGSLDALTQAVNLSPLDPAFAAELGSGYQLVGDDPLAEYWLNTAVTLSDNDPRFQALLDAFRAQTPPN